LREHEESVDAQTALRHRNDMLASLAHELRTPLTALTLRLDRLATSVRAATDDPLIAKQTVAVEVHARRLNDRVRDLIEAQRLSHFVEVPLLYASVDLAEMARAVVEVQAPSASKHESPVTVSGATDVYGTWDAERVEQILGALLSNAIAYGEGKPIDVRIQSDGVVATVDVVDRGPGIDAVDRERIFEQFERGPGARARGGFGLGLWVARKAARAHGGDIELETEPRRGSTFRVRLPLEPPTLSTKTAAASNAAPMTAMPQR
jgi:signal transduction histidine kinase